MYPYFSIYDYKIVFLIEYSLNNSVFNQFTVFFLVLGACQ